jgi:hypothetical protein
LNFIESIKLLEAVSDFPFKQSEKKPDFSIYDNQNQGYSLRVKAGLVNAEYLKFVKEIVESLKLRMIDSEGYLTIYAP